MSALEDLKDRQDAAVEAGFCACLCGEPLPSRVRGRRNLNERHKDTARNAREAARAADLGLPTRSRRIAVSRLDPSNPTSTRGSHASARRRPRQTRHREGVQIYLPTVELAERVRTALAGIPEAREIVGKALTRRRARESRASA